MWRGVAIASLTDLIEASDLDGLIRHVDGLASSRAWSDLLEVRRRCDEAVERGKQVWSIRSYAGYRLALDAPGEFAGPMVAAGDDRHTLGPLWEVAASTHAWGEIGHHIPESPEKDLAADERVLRGEFVDHEGEVLELPSELLAWEPTYALATYRSDRVDAPAPEIPRPTREIPARLVDASSSDVDEALLELVRPWVDSSGGTARVLTVDGPVESAAATAADGPVRGVTLSLEQAVAWMAWVGASGGAYGRRRGGAVGRFNAWWALAAMCGLGWPADPATLAARAAKLEWLRFAPAAIPTGWELHLAVGDGQRSWAVAATDPTG